MKKAMLVLVLILLYLLTSSGLALAAENPDQSAKNFFKAVNDVNSQEAWTRLTETSRKGIIKMIAAQAKENDEEKVRKMMEEKPELMDTFWANFKKSARADVIYQKATFKTLSDNGKLAIVQMSIEDSKLKLKMFKEKGSWKMGWIESFLKK